jgi:hypothetical protein
MFGPFPDKDSKDRKITRNILGLLKFRYNRSLALQLNKRTAAVYDQFAKLSVLHNPDQFRWIKSLYMNDQVSYAVTAVTNPEFYREVKKQFPEAGTRFAMNISNIFDCQYSNLTFFDLQNLLRDTSETFGASNTNPLVVFRTTNYDTPHGFYRYDITSEWSVPKDDEGDSKASHIPDYKRVKSKANGF